MQTPLPIVVVGWLDEYATPCATVKLDVSRETPASPSWNGDANDSLLEAALKAEYEVMQVATLHRDAAVVALHQQYAALLG